MTVDVTIPAIGESITEGILARWLAESGTWVEEGTPIYELETDKVSSEVQAEISGLLTCLAEEGETVDVGGVIGQIDPDAEKPAATSPTPAETAPQPDTAVDDISDQPTPKNTGSAQRSSPAARKLLEERGIKAEAVSGSGLHGTVTKSDVMAHLADCSAPSSSPAKPGPSAPVRPTESGHAQAEAGFTRKKMTPLRKAIAKRLINAQRTAAILTTFNEVDMSSCMELRKRFKQEFADKHQTGLGFMSFFVKAAVKALEAYPLVNSSIDGDDIVTPDGIHMGIAVGTDRGLVVPVLRNAEDMGFADIESGIRGYAAKAREGKLTISDMEGGTFTITNGGVYGSLLSTPIINPPQSGILGMHGIQDRPIAVNGEVVIRPMMYIALSYDHRIVDGAEAVGFLVRIKELIETPERLIFDL